MNDDRPLTAGRLQNLLAEAAALEPKDPSLPIKRKAGKPVGTPSFVKVKRAREAMAAMSNRAVKLLGIAAKIAAEKGDSSPAEFILKHVGAPDEQGKMVRPLMTSVDKLEGEGGPRMPTINIGWIVAPETPQPALPATVIDVLALPEHDDG